MELVELNRILDQLESGSREKGGSIASGIISIGGTHLSSTGGFKWGKKDFVSEEFYSMMRVGKVQRNDILIVKDGATTGKTSFVDEDFPFNDAAINEHVFRLQINARSANPKYVFYFLYSTIGQEQILSDFRGATVGGISRGFVDLVKVPLPDLETQNKIVAILDKAKSLLDKREKTIALYDELLRATFLEIFGDPILNPKGWKVDSLKNFGKLKNGLNFGGAEQGLEIKCLGVGDFKFLWKLNNMSTLSSITLSSEPSEEYFLKNGDMVFVRSNGNKELVGRCLIVYPNDERVAFSGFCIRYRLHSNEITPTFLSQLFRDPNFRRKMLQNGRGANIQNISQQLLEELDIPIPPPELQQLFSSIVEKIASLFESLIKSSELSLSLLKALSQQIFSEKAIIDLDVELEALINAVDLNKNDQENNINTILNDVTFVQRLIDRLNNQEFNGSGQYGKAKYILFRIMREEGNLIKQVFKNSKVELTLKNETA